MFHSAFPRGQGPAFTDLPPTLQPCVIAASAPASDHLRVAAIAGLIYAALGVAVVALSSLASPPTLRPVHATQPEQTFVFEPLTAFRLMLPHPTADRGSGAGHELALPTPVAPPSEASSEAASGLPTEDHHGDLVGAAPGAPGATAPPGIPGTGPTVGAAVDDVRTLGLAVLRRVDPVYPDFARHAHIQGAVVLLMTVDERGVPVQVQIMEGHPVFHEAAVQAARQWRFEPARLEGRPVSASFRLTLKFSLR